MHGRKPHGLAVALLAILGLLGGWPPGNPDRLRAELRFQQTTCEVGQVRGGTVLTPHFAFTNVGAAPVEITEVRPGCGCLKPRLTQQIVQPGETGKIVLEVDTRRESAGAHVWQLAVRWRRGNEAQETTLRVFGHVVTEVTVQPAALTIMADQPLRSTVVVTDLRPTPMSLRSVETSSPRLRAFVSEPRQSPLNQRTWAIRVEAAETCPPGRHEEKLTIHTQDADHPLLEVPVTIVKREQSRVEAIPKNLLVSLTTGQQGKRTVTLRDRQGQPVVVEAINVDHQALTCTATGGESGQVTLTLRVDGNKAGTGFSGRVGVRLSSPARETLMLLVDCVVD